MDPSALIFIALAVAWAAYLIPQAIKHHDAVQRTRSVESFSSRMRVLARREPTSTKDSRLVVTGERSVRPDAEAKRERAEAPVVESRPVREPRPVSAAARRSAANAAARRRRNVLSGLVTLLVVVAGLALGGLFSTVWIGVPAGLIAAWLVACRLMVKQERRPVAPAAPAVVEEQTTVISPVRVELHDETGEIVAVTVDDDPSRWDMVPVTLPTYVTKSAAEKRTVSTIDLESTGVWTSGRTEVDAEIAREAEARRKAGNRIAEARQQQRAVGS